MVWTFDKILERTQRAVAPSDQAIIFGDHMVTWGELAQRTDRLAAGLLAHGAEPGDKVAHYLRNGAEYIETSVACFKAGLVHVNVNYRYTENELFYLFDNADVAVIVYDPDFAPQMAQLRERLTKVKLFVETGAPLNAFALPYESLATAKIVFEPPHLTDDPLLFIYTGGTTGAPKGVMWRHDDLWRALGGPRDAGGYDDFEADLRAGNRGARVLICPPLMHGAGYMFALLQLLRGGTVLMAPGASFDPDAVLAMIAAHRPGILLIVGDAFGRPLAKALGQARYDCASLGVIVSSGAMWSSDVKDEITAAIPHVRCLDALGSSEVIGLGISVRGGGQGASATRFKSDPMTRVIAEDGSPIAPGSGIAGRIARAGPVPLGYYKDPEKTARTFITIEGVRHVLPGDYGTIEADGTIKLLGRGNMVINSGGEKIFVEEIEEALKKHPAIDDALVFGMPDPVWGQAVTAVVEAQAPVSAEALRGFLGESLARYKLPKLICFAEKVPRGPNGKANYEAARAIASIHGATK